MKAIRIFLFAWVIFMTGNWSQGAYPDGPTEQLKPSLDSLIEILENESLKGDAKKNRTKKHDHEGDQQRI